MLFIDNVDSHAEFLSGRIYQDPTTNNYNLALPPSLAEEAAVIPPESHDSTEIFSLHNVLDWLKYYSSSLTQDFGQLFKQGFYQLFSDRNLLVS